MFHCLVCRPTGHLQRPHLLNQDRFHRELLSGWSSLKAYRQEDERKSGCNPSDSHFRDINIACGRIEHVVESDLPETKTPRSKTKTKTKEKTAMRGNKDAIYLVFATLAILTAATVGRVPPTSISPAPYSTLTYLNATQLILTPRLLPPPPVSAIIQRCVESDLI